MRTTKLLLPLFILFWLTIKAQTEVPKLINYQGKLTTPEGACVDTTVLMEFSIYSDSARVDPLWTETQTSVKVDKGIFNALLGSVNEIPESVFTGNVRYLGVKVADDPEMTPRKQIVSVGYAYKTKNSDQATNADMVYGRHASDFVRFIYQDFQHVTGPSGSWVSAKTCTLAANTVTSHLIVFYDVSAGCARLGARITVNGLAVDSMWINCEHDGDFVFKSRVVKIDVDNSIPLTLTLDLSGYNTPYVLNDTFLILGN